MIARCRRGDRAIGGEAAQDTVGTDPIEIGAGGIQRSGIGVARGGTVAELADNSGTLLVQIQPLEEDAKER